jgi:hypothetical protein
MPIFKSERDLLDVLDRHDALVRRCIAGAMDFDRFCDEYNDFYAFYALDGHESDSAERDLFEKHELRIRPHEFIAFEILGRVCSDADAELVSYKLAGRISSRDAILMLSRVQLPGASHAEV